MRSAKLLVQEDDNYSPQHRHTPLSSKGAQGLAAVVADQQLHPDFSRAFFEGEELMDDTRVRPKRRFDLRFAVPKDLAENLRTCLFSLTEKFPNDNPIAAGNEEQLRDEMIVQFVLDTYLNLGLQNEARVNLYIAALNRSEKVEDMTKLDQEAFDEELDKVFDSKVLPVINISYGETPHAGFHVDAKRSNFRYKTCYGIPVTVNDHNRVKQNAYQAGRDRMVVERNSGDISRPGDSNACWLLGNQTYTVGIH